MAVFVAFDHLARNSGRSATKGVESTALTVGDMVGAGEIGLGFTTATVTPITTPTTTTATATRPNTNPRRRRSGCASTNGGASIELGSGWMTSSASACSSRRRGSLDSTSSGWHPDTSDTADTS